MRYFEIWRLRWDAGFKSTLRVNNNDFVTNDNRNVPVFPHQQQAVKLSQCRGEKYQPKIGKKEKVLQGERKNFFDIPVILFHLFIYFLQIVHVSISFMTLEALKKNPP